MTRSPAPPRPRPRIDPARAAQLAGVVAAAVLAIVLNVLAARHYRRWDVTAAQRYTLSPATLTTLRELSEPLDVWVMLGGGAPLEQSVKQLLVAYQAETRRIDVHDIDPDKAADLPALEDVRKRFKIEVGRSTEGRVVTDAVVVVARGDRHWFLSESDMFEVAGGGDDTRVKPREEQAITQAIRNVLGGDKVRLCFTTGHGEPQLADGTEDGLGVLKDLLEKDNFDAVAVDTTDPSAHEPFKGCAVAIVAAPRGPFAEDEAARLRTYLLEGGSALIAAGPINAASPNGMAPLGLDRALAPFGVGLDDDLIFEIDPRDVIPESRGIRFLIAPKPHAVTSALVATDDIHDPPRVVVQFARSLRRVTEEGAAPPSDLLVTSGDAFAVSSIAGASEWTSVPEKRPEDRKGPLVVAMASERPKVGPKAPHGPRVVVLGTGSVMAARNWRDPGPVHGAAFFVENAISWLAARPEVLDIPEKPTVAAGIRITDASRSEIRLYVLVFMPLAIGLLGAAIFAWRRSTERVARAKKAEG